MRIALSLTLALILATVGCQAPKSVPFAPLSARLEPVPGSAALYFVVINTSGQELHNYRYSAYLYSELLRRHPFARKLPIRQYVGSGYNLGRSQIMRFRRLDKNIEDPIVEAITRVQIVGHCDEGHFRQEWTTTESGELRPVETNLR